MHRGDRVRLTRVVAGMMPREEAVVVGFYRREDEEVVVKLMTGEALVVPVDAIEVVEAATSRVEAPELGRARR